MEAGSGIELGNDTGSVSKSASNWLSAIGGESISIHSDLMHLPVENQQPPIAQTYVSVIDIGAGIK